jgi:hypothetical protein
VTKCMTQLSVLTTFCLVSAVCLAAEATADAPRYEPVVQTIEGYQVYVDPSMLRGEHAEDGARALKMLANHLQRIEVLLPADRVKELQTVGIWIERRHPKLGNMQYHPGEKWLTDRGYEKELNKKVHITVASRLFNRGQMLKHPAVILHELAHAYHDQILGFDDPRIIKAYEAAMEEGLYDKVLLYNGKMVRHYAATNHKEYFAEGTEAYFYRNDFYPFTAAELKQHDPRLYKLLAEIWGPIE